MQTNNVLGVLVGAVLWTFAAAASLAQDQPGRLSARSFTPLPTPLVIDVEPDDNTDANIALAQRMAETLARSGIRVAPKTSPLVLRFDSEVRENVSPERQRFDRESSTPRDDDLRGGASGPPDQRDEVANVFSSQGRGLMGPRRGERDYARALRYVINARIEGRGDGRRFWQGHLSYDTATTEGAALLEEMVPILLHEVGNTVQERRFALP